MAIAATALLVFLGFVVLAIVEWVNAHRWVLVAVPVAFGLVLWALVAIGRRKPTADSVGKGPRSPVFDLSGCSGEEVEQRVASADSTGGRQQFV
jgi:hypothetical protein